MPRIARTNDPRQEDGTVGAVIENRWDDAGAARCTGALGARVYTSRLLGVDPDLVLHGGGNTSVKLPHTTVFGDTVDALVVKGSGSDLADMEESGFAWLRLDAVARLAELDALSDTQMAQELRLAEVVAAGPAPSVEAILHALIPARFVDHTHADAVVTLTNTPGGVENVTEVYGDRVLVVPYVMPGFKLARLFGEMLPRAGDVDGAVLMNHGIFTWGETAKESYDRMIELVQLADLFVAARRRPWPAARPAPQADRLGRARLRRDISVAAGRPMVVHGHSDEESMGFIAHPDLAEITQRGTATPDHVIRTKPWPLLGRDVDGYVQRYREYFERHRGTRDLERLDPAPRVVLDRELGMSCAGGTPREAGVAADVYRHTMKVILDAEALGGYQPATIADLFDVEYWELEQAKLRRGAKPAPFAGEVALVTGAAGGIGKACAEALMAEGAAVVGIDVDPEIKVGFDGPNWLGIQADVTDGDAMQAALDATVERFGGLDILVLNAGVFPSSTRLSDLQPEAWRRVMAVNVDAGASLLSAAHPLLALAPAPNRGRVVVIGSKNVPGPGPGVAAYSASKSALTQLARVAALEWGPDGIRVNVIHPNAVFDTAIWSDEMLAERAAHYGMTVEEYRKNNVLGIEVTSPDVARMCVALCGPSFAKTTGAQVAVDGGNERVI
jgi:rhamnose utilization protein RhaD (predicted bifunctional aldolase and dehydrogenase)/NAD(P)-dependent dehydrogenase (short-subunit alcohol dehydrogenase family)